MSEAAALLDDIEEINVILPSGRYAVATRRADLPRPFIYECRQEDLRYLRLTRAPDGALAIEDATREMLELLLARLKAGKARTKGEKKARAARLARAKVVPKPGAPPAERLAKGDVARALHHHGEASVQPTVYIAPPGLERLHKGGTITANMLHAATAFHETFIKAGLEQLRAVDLNRVSGGRGREPDAVLNAREELYEIFDHMGGIGKPCSRALWHVAGMDRNITEFAEAERAGDWRLEPRSARGVVIGALGALEGFYRGRRKRRGSAG